MDKSDFLSSQHWVDKNTEFETTGVHLKSKTLVLNFWEKFDDVTLQPTFLRSNLTIYLEQMQNSLLTGLRKSPKKLLDIGFASGKVEL